VRIVASIAPNHVGGHNGVHDDNVAGVECPTSVPYFRRFGPPILENAVNVVPTEDWK
jgi:hypothetical protein